MREFDSDHRNHQRMSDMLLIVHQIKGKHGNQLECLSDQTEKGMSAIIKSSDTGNGILYLVQDNTITLNTMKSSVFEWSSQAREREIRIAIQEEEGNNSIRE